MTKRWLEMRLAIPAHAVDLVSQFLTELGCTGVIAAEQQLDTFVVPNPSALENAPVLRAFFPFPEHLPELQQHVVARLKEVQAVLDLPELPVFECRELADEDWASSWQQHFTPFKVGRRLVICPSWEKWRATAGDVILTLDPGQAFGTGSHSTTSLCLDVIADCYAATPGPRRVLDVGTGSGILAMAAAALGAERVTACDIDEDACRVARANVAQNGLSGRVAISDRPLAQLSGHYDLVLANILAAENIRLGRQLAERLAPGGILVLSGMLAEQESAVREGFADYPLELTATRHRDEWICMVYHCHE